MQDEEGIEDMLHNPFEQYASMNKWYPFAHDFVFVQVRQV